MILKFTHRRHCALPVYLLSSLFSPSICTLLHLTYSTSLTRSLTLSNPLLPPHLLQHPQTSLHLSLSPPLSSTPHVPVTAPYSQPFSRFQPPQPIPSANTTLYEPISPHAHRPTIPHSFIPLCIHLFRSPKEDYLFY